MSDQEKQWREAQVGRPIIAEVPGSAIGLPTGSCPRCGAAWGYLSDSRQWLWKERSGAAYFLKEYRDLKADGSPPPLKRCPGCKAKLEKA